MARKWDEVKKQFDGEPDIEERRGRARADLAAEIDAFNATLADLRRAQGYTQMQLSKILGVSQGQVSKVERQADLYLSTLASYLEALGAELELAAVLEDGTRVTLAISDRRRRRSTGAGGREGRARWRRDADRVAVQTPRLPPALLNPTGIAEGRDARVLTSGYRRPGSRASARVP